MLITGTEITWNLKVCLNITLKMEMVENKHKTFKSFGDWSHKVFLLESRLQLR